MSVLSTADIISIGMEQPRGPMGQSLRAVCGMQLAIWPWGTIWHTAWRKRRTGQHQINACSHLPKRTAEGAMKSTRYRPSAALAPESRSRKDGGSGEPVVPSSRAIESRLHLVVHKTTTRSRAGDMIMMALPMFPACCTSMPSGVRP
jgi:hypothetical protein